METQAVRIHRYGGPEVLQAESLDIGEPGAGEVRIRHTAIGLNFIDTYHRSGLYPSTLPAGIGAEAAGVIESVGEGVTGCAPGDRVAYAGLPPGAYAGYRNFRSSALVPLPDGVSDEQAAAVMLKGLTAWYLLRRSYQVKAGDPILLYAAAGGVGSLATQWARYLGASVIGIVSTEEKAELARDLGCDHVLMAGEPDIPGAVRELTGGEGVAAVYDSVGKDTFIQSLDCLRPHGVMVTFGNATGPVEPFAPAELAKRHSLYVTRPSLFDFIAKREDLLEGAGELFGLIEGGIVKVNVNQRYPLADAGRAHADLEARRTTGSTVLIP